MKTKNLILIFGILMSFSKNIDAQTVNRGPYLQLVTNSSIYIHWRTNSPTNSKVWYGNDPNNLTSTLSIPGNRTNHAIHITGLSSNTVYYYAVGNNSGQMEGADDDHFFKTSPNQYNNETVRAWVLGNAGNNSGDQEDVRDGFYNYIGNTNLDLMLLLGDNAYDDGTDSEYQNSWFNGMYQDHIINTVMYSTFGNHDGGASDSDDETGPYYNIFNFPKNAQAGGVASGTEAYYSFDYGNIHFICINSYDIDRDVGEPMYDWVVDDLDNTNKDWIVAFFHYPPYTGNDNNSSDTHPKETDMRENFLPVLEAAGVDLVLSAHHHSYQRSYLINGHYDVSSTWNSNTMGLDLGDGRSNGNGEYFKEVGEEGTVYIVSGSAGGTGSDPDGYPAMFTSAQSLGSVYLEVTGLQMDIAFIDDNGNVDDYFTILKDTPPIVNITNPSDLEYFPSPQDINITATATDNGTISNIEFFINNISIGTDYSFPYSKTWSVPDSGTYEIKAVATDNLNSMGSKTINVEVGDGTVCVQINSDDDDGEEKPNGDVNLGSGDLELTEDPPHNQTVAMRFTGLTIPQGAAINSAYIQFTCDKNDNANPCIIDIYAQDSDNALPFSTNDFDLSNRPKTTAKVTWSPANWINNGDSGPAQKTGDISSVIQEVVSRPDFVDNSSIVIIMEGTGEREAESHDGSIAGAPELCVNFDLNGPLPIELLTFNARTIGKEIQLEWATASELKNDFFTIERSDDGRNFQEIGTLPGNGTTSEVSNYDFIDKYPKSGMNYYRLKQTDYDQKFSYSQIVSAKIVDEQRFFIYPTMVKDIIAVEKGMDIDEEVSIIIYDLTGKAHHAFKFAADQNKMELSLTELCAGTYFLSIFDSKTKQTFKFVKF